MQVSQSKESSGVRGLSQHPLGQGPGPFELGKIVNIFSKLGKIAHLLNKEYY